MTILRGTVAEAAPSPHNAERRLYRLGVLACLLLPACNSTGASNDDTLRFQGRVTVEDQPATFPGQVNVYSYSQARAPTGTYSITVTMDSTGHYAGKLGPFVDGRIDSVWANVGVTTCEGASPAAAARLAQPRPGPVPATLPVMNLSFQVPLGRLGRDSVVCGATLLGGELGEHPGLRLIFDTLGVLIHGRWDLSHTASFGDSYGRFTGYVLNDTLYLPLTPSPEIPCTGLTAWIPLAPDSTFGVAQLGGAPAPACYAPVSPLLLFQSTGWPSGLPIVRTAR